MNTPKYQLVAPPQLQTSACAFECCQSCDYHSVVPCLTLRNNVCLFSLAGHEATGSLRCDHEQHPVILSTHQTGPCHTRQRWGELLGGAAYPWWKGAPRSLVWSSSALRVSRLVLWNSKWHSLHCLLSGCKMTCTKMCRTGYRSSYQLRIFSLWENIL